MDFGCPLGGLGAQFLKKKVFGPCFFLTCFWYGPWHHCLKISSVLAIPRTWKSIEIHAIVVINQGSHKFGLRWIRDASGFDFAVILEAGGIILVPLGYFFLILEGPRDRTEI